MKENNFYEIVWIFYLGAFLGDVVETLFCRWRTGRWMSRSSVVCGPFSIVWGGSIAIATILLFRYKEASALFLFWTGAILGGAFEYLCSVFTEKMFGKVFWDYRKIRFNLNGRINLVYCLLWGLASVIWFKGMYPPLSKWIESILKNRAGIFITWFMAVFMVCDAVISYAALVRSAQRTSGVRASHKWQRIMDKYFDDEKLYRIYPNAINVAKA